MTAASPSVLVAALACGLAAAVLLLPATSRPARHDDPAGPGSTTPRTTVLLAAAGGTAVAVGGVAPRIVVLLAVAAASAVVGARLVQARRTAQQAGVRRHRVVELCVGLRAELAAGLTPAAALERAAEEWELVRPAARTADQAGDVPAALRDLADTPGAEALRIVAAAWQVAHRTGVGLAVALDRVAEDLRAAERTGRVVAGELASARATARLLAVLPVLALAMGSGAGGDPVGFLLGEPAGIACLVGGLALTAAGLAWIDGLARAVERAS